MLVVSHPELKGLFAETLENSLQNAGLSFEWTLFPSGEAQKNLSTVYGLYDACAQAHIDKKNAVVALGGGVVQDTSNYLAATYLRGVPFIQIPTTLLSQVDAGIGGCAVDHPAGKSLIGQFYQPRAVIMDSSTLKTLPKNELVNGIAEIINKVICLGGSRTDGFNQDIRAIINGDENKALDYVKSSNKVKLGIIERDETGTNETRFLLDWGHTITYALERTLNYSISHGRALGIGMHGAAVLSQQLGYLSRDKVRELKQAIEDAGLPAELPVHVDNDKLINYMCLDQKVVARRKRFVLLRDFGDAFVSEGIDDNQITSCLDEIRERPIA